MKTKRDNLAVLTRSAASILVGGVLSAQAGCYQTVSAQPARTVTVAQAPWPSVTAVSAPAPAVPPMVGRRLATLYRYADQYDEYFVRGDAAISDSPVFSSGIRLAAWDAQDPNDVSRIAVASAVYLFSIPAGTATLRLDIGYRRAEVARDDAVAGLVYVRNLAVEEQYKPDAEPDGEPGFYGNSYVLFSNDTRTVFDIAAADRVIDGVLELHLSAGAGQAFDADYVQVTAMADPVVVVSQVTTQVIPSPWTYTYCYYYIGPWNHCYADHVVAYTFYVDDVDPFFWGGWVTHRAFFFAHHPWAYRPGVYAHPGHFHHHRRPGPFAGGHPGVMGYRQDWYRRHFRMDDSRMTEQDLDTHVRTHREVRPEGDRIRHEQEQRRIAETVRVSQERLRQAEGNRYHDRVADWSRDPRLARQELQTFGDRDPDVRRARESWQLQRPHGPETGTSEQRPDLAPGRPPATEMVKPAAAGPVRPTEPISLSKPEPLAPRVHSADWPRPEPGKPADAGPVRPTEPISLSKPEPLAPQVHGADRPRPEPGKPAADRKPEVAQPGPAGAAPSVPGASVPDSARTPAAGEPRRPAKGEPGDRPQREREPGNDAASKPTGGHAPAPVLTRPNAEGRPEQSTTAPGAAPTSERKPHREETTPASPAPAPGATESRQRPNLERPAGSPSRTPERATTPSARPSQPAPATPVPTPAAPTQPPNVQPPAAATPATPVLPQPSERRNSRPERNGPDRGTDKVAPAPVLAPRPAEPRPSDAGDASRRASEKRAPTVPATPAARATPTPAPAPAGRPQAAPADAASQPAATETAEPDSEKDKRKGKDERERNGRH